MELLLNPAKAKWPPGCNRRWREGKEDQPKSINFIFLFYLILFYFIIFQEHSFKKKNPLFLSSSPQAMPSLKGGLGVPWEKTLHHQDLDEFSCSLHTQPVLGPSGWVQWSVTYLTNAYRAVKGWAKTHGKTKQWRDLAKRALAGS